MPTGTRDKKSETLSFGIEFETEIVGVHVSNSFASALCHGARVGPNDRDSSVRRDCLCRPRENPRAHPTRGHHRHALWAVESSPRVSLEPSVQSNLCSLG